MANEKQETSADIIKEMRDLAEIDKNIGDKIPRSLMALGMETYAERLEAANKRATVGDAAAMREALEAALKTIRGVINSTISPRSNTVFDCRDKLSAALSAPPRNCDVGTPEEQAERQMNFCRNHPKCTGCPCVGGVKYNKCEFAWAQMPYEANESEAR